MLSALRWCALCLVLLLSGPSLAAEPSQKVIATASTHPEGLLLRFELPQAVTQLSFAEPAEAVRNESWSVPTPGLTLKGDKVSSARLFKRFEVLVRPDRTEVDRGYPALVRVGQGAVFYGPYALVRGVETELRTNPGWDETALPERAAWRGYVFLGPSAHVRRLEQLSIVNGPDAPAWLVKRISLDVPQAIAFYQKVLATPLSGRPAVMVTDQTAGPMPLRGDVTDNLAISLRFHGDGWREENPAWARQASKIVLHETFHLWNSHSFHSAEGDAAPWLHEGGAEYAALVAGASLGVLTEDQAREQLGSSLTGCRSALKDKPLSGGAVTKGSAVYNCGVLVQWLADLQARREGRDIFSVWRQVFARASANKVTYRSEDFRSAAPDRSGVLSSVLDGSSADRWDRLAAGLDGLGVELRREPTPAAYRVAVVFHLNALHCTESNTGFYTQNGFIKLDTRQVCGPLSGDPEITAIEGQDLFDKAAEAYAAVERKCRDNGTVSLKRRGGGPDIIVPCAKPLPSPQPSYVVVRSPALALPGSGSPAPAS